MDNHLLFKSDMLSRFLALDNELDRFDFVSELALFTPGLGSCTEDNRIRGCDSRLWLHLSLDGGAVHLRFLCNEMSKSAKFVIHYEKTNALSKWYSLYIRILKKTVAKSLVYQLFYLDERGVFSYMKRAIEVKINVKPIFSNVVHTSIWEGPCRVGTPEELSPEYESRVGREQCRVWADTLRSQIGNCANVLEPAYIEYPESFYVSDESFAVLLPDLNDVDIFLISYRLPGLERMGKPMSMINNGPAPADLGAFYSSIGKEFYFAHDYEEYNEILSLLQVRKAIRNTKLLVLTACEQFPVSVNSSNPDLFGLNLRYGLRSARRSIKDVFNVMKRLDCEKDISDKADSLIACACEANITKEWISSDLRYYEAVKMMMEELGCNAFTTACKELCASRLPMEHKCTPCLTHSLFKDSGIPTACEEDLNVFMAVMIFMYLSRKSVFMGNPSLVHKHRRPIEDLGMTKLLSGPAEGFDEDVLEIRHAVPSLKLEGFDQPDMPYDIGHFTLAGWGAKIQVDLSSGTTKTVTIGRFSRDGKRMIVTRGEILGCAYRDIECSPAVYYRVEGGARAFRHALAEGQYGHHLAVIYGDYTDQVKALSKIVGFEVEHHR